MAIIITTPEQFIKTYGNKDAPSYSHSMFAFDEFSYMPPYILRVLLTPRDLLWL